MSDKTYTGMKRYIILIACLLAAATASADEKSEAILGRVAKVFGGYADYEVRFTVEVQGMQNMKGNYFVSGNKYRIKLQEQEQFSDGQYRYEVFPAEKEVVIDNVDVSSSDILSNPTRAFEFAPGEFDSEYKGQVKIGSTVCDVIALTPRKGKYGGIGAVLYVNADTAAPVSIIYDTQGDRIDIIIDRIIPMDKVDDSIFVFDPGKYRNYEIIDFR